MRRSEVEKWIADHGQADYREEYIQIPNPNATGRFSNPTITVKQVTWIGNDGQRLTVIDQTNEDTPGPWASGREENGQVVGDPEYQVVGQGREVPKDSRTPEKARDDAVIISEKEKNLRQTGHWETDVERRQREAQDQARQRQQTIDQQAAQNEQTRLGMEGQRLTIAQQADQRAAAAQVTAANQADERLDIDRNRFALEERRANQPTILGTPGDDDKNIAMFDPTTGQVRSQANPLYDEAKAKAKQIQEELALAIQMNKLNADQAAQVYSQWFKQNVEVPFMQASEARAAAADRRAALEAETRNKQFAAQHGIQRAQLGQQAASTMVNAEIGMLPYRVGPAYGDQMSSAINSLAHGGTLDGPKADAGINFTADAFEYDAPDLKKIAKDATKQALKGVTPYDPDEMGDVPTADYSGIAMPAANVMAGAPAQPNYIDTNAMYQNWINSKYGGPSTP